MRGMKRTATAKDFHAACYKLIGFGLASLLIAGSALNLSCKRLRSAATNSELSNSQASNSQPSNSQATDTQGNIARKQINMAGSPIIGGEYEASGVVHVPGTDFVLIVDDGMEYGVLLMQVDQSGRQVGNVTPVRIGAAIENPEGITCDGTRFYMVGSQSSPKKGQMNAIARFSLDPNTKTVSGVEVIRDLRTLLISRVPGLRGDAEMKGEDGGLNIEGIAWDPPNSRLLLGLRSPVRAGQALLLPVKLRDANGPFTADNLDLANSQLIELSLGGMGVRDIQYDSTLKSFLLISGAPENIKRSEFVLWQWDGASAPKRLAQLDPIIKPEGITEMKFGDSGFIFMVGDANRYLKLDYTDFE